MGTKNDLIKQQRETWVKFFHAGQETGRQQILDMVSLVLHDPDIMGKDVFGKERLLKVVKGIGDYLDKYEQAWQKTDETDYYRAKLDAALAEVYGESLHDSFLERYDYAPEYDYNKGRWK